MCFSIPTPAITYMGLLDIRKVFGFVLCLHFALFNLYFVALTCLNWLHNHVRMLPSISLTASHNLYQVHLAALPYSGGFGILWGQVLLPCHGQIKMCLNVCIKCSTLCKCRLTFLDHQAHWPYLKLWKQISCRLSLSIINNYLNFNQVISDLSISLLCKELNEQYWMLA